MTLNKRLSRTVVEGIRQHVVPVPIVGLEVDAARVVLGVESFSDSRCSRLVRGSAAVGEHLHANAYRDVNALSHLIDPIQ